MPSHSKTAQDARSGTHPQEIGGGGESRVCAEPQGLIDAGT